MGIKNYLLSGLVILMGLFPVLSFSQDDDVRRLDNALKSCGEIHVYQPLPGKDSYNNPSIYETYQSVQLSNNTLQFNIDRRIYVNERQVDSGVKEFVSLKEVDSCEMRRAYESVFRLNCDCEVGTQCFRQIVNGENSRKDFQFILNACSEKHLIVVHEALRNLIRQSRQ